MLNNPDPVFSLFKSSVFYILFFAKINFFGTFPFPCFSMEPIKSLLQKSLRKGHTYVAFVESNQCDQIGPFLKGLGNKFLHQK